MRHGQEATGAYQFWNTTLNTGSQLAVNSPGSGVNSPIERSVQKPRTQRNSGRVERLVSRDHSNSVLIEKFFTHRATTESTGAKSLPISTIFITQAFYEVDFFSYTLFHFAKGFSFSL
jgi:hypothetical protein